MSAIEDMRAEALFASTLQPSTEPNPEAVNDAVTAALLMYGAEGCAAYLAQEYGDHPDTARDRTRWAHVAVRSAFQPAHA